MKKVVLGVSVFLAAMAVGSMNANEAKTKTDNKEDVAARRAKRIADAGGLVQVSGGGKVVVLNCQSTTPELQFVEDAKRIGREIKTTVEVRSTNCLFSVASAKKLVERSGGNAVIFITDDSALPMSLVALEERWGVVNVAAMKVDGPSQEKINSRVHKMFLRVVCNVLGASTSHYATSPLQPVSSLSDLDKVIGDTLTFDSVGAMLIHMPKIGISRIKYMSFRKACYEGIAPAPANDLQRKIADEVRRELSEEAAVSKRPSQK